MLGTRSVKGIGAALSQTRQSLEEAGIRLDEVLCKRTAGGRTAPPVRMRLRCWYEVVIETRARKRIVLREEGLRGDNVRTASRALERWRASDARYRNELVVVRDIRVAKSQPRLDHRTEAST